MSEFSFPDPADYDICSERGFLSSVAPPTTFENAYYEPWDGIIPKLSRLISEGSLVEEIHKLPLLETHRLRNEAEFRRAYVVLAFLVHGYVWCQTPPNRTLPPQLTEPFFGVCQYLGLKPVLSYVGLCSWNWHIRGGSNGDISLENLDTLASFTGTRGEAAFYHVPVLIEAEGGHLVRLMLDAMDAAQRGRTEFVVEALKNTTRTLARMGTHLYKFYEVLNPSFLYNDLRPFLAGGREAASLPEGMIFKRSDGSTVPLRLIGGSAAQSSLFHFIDRALDVEHRDQTNFDEMRVYMPGIHYNFLAKVDQLPSLRPFVNVHQNDAELMDAYNDCLRSLMAWREKHLDIVSRYVVQPAKEARNATRTYEMGTAVAATNGRSCRASEEDRIRTSYGV